MESEPDTQPRVFPGTATTRGWSARLARMAKINRTRPMLPPRNRLFTNFLEDGSEGLV
jgi:hypothetical protein